MTELELLHTRSYDVRVFLLDEDTLMVRGQVRDEKPPDLYVADDPDPLEIHNMVVELTIGLARVEITDVNIEFRTHPAEMCPAIVESYGRLVGLNVARGFNRKVRELFGGPRGCTHTTALLQAMAPVVIQSFWSVQTWRNKQAGLPRGGVGERSVGDIGRNLNTCHVWDEDGETVAAVKRGEMRGVPVQIGKRLVALGRDPNEWRPAN